MPLHSAWFWAFLAVTCLVHSALAPRGPRWQKAVLLASSLVFYCWDGLGSLPILLSAVAINALASVGMATLSARWRKPIFFAGLSLSVALLGVFKYGGFLTANLNALLGTRLTWIDYGLPLGISFFTLQQVMWLVDDYQGLRVPAGPLDRLLVASFFPYVSAGPITRAQELLPQLGSPISRAACWDNVANGLPRFSVGLAKKVVLADSLARVVDLAFQHIAELSVASAWIGAACFALQLYLDFSGYTDMAIGAAAMLGIALPENFDRPLRATSIIEFWKRWHMTLSRFITSYLYTPIIRAQKWVTFGKAMLATIVTMTIAGLWHGAAWTYVVFGLVHGLALVVNHLSRRRRWPMPAPFGWLLTTLFLIVAFVIFRAPSIEEAASFLSAMGGRHGVSGLEVFAELSRPEQGQVALLTIASLTVTYWPSALPKAPKRSLAAAMVAALLLVLSAVFINSGIPRGFIYRDF